MALIVERGRLRTRRAGAPVLMETRNRRWVSSVAVQALDQLAAGIIVTDSSAGVVEMNRAGEAIVRVEDGLLIRNDRLRAGRVFETAKVGKLIAGATAEGKLGAAAGRMLIARGNGLLAYVLTVAPLRTGILADERRLAMIVVVDPVRHASSATDLAEFFGLSRGEARLAATLLTGKSLADIAADTREPQIWDDLKAQGEGGAGSSACAGLAVAVIRRMAHSNTQHASLLRGPFIAPPFAARHYRPGRPA